jgi:hypothetical protein
MKFTIQLLAAVLMLGCAKKEASAPVAQGTGPAASASSTQPVTWMGSHPQGTPGAAKEMSAPAAAPAQGTLTGKVVETMDSGGYTYLRLKTANGETWAAVRSAKVSVGQEAIIVDAMEMHGFQSKTLNRTFDSIYFGSLPAEPGPAASGSVSPGKPEAAGMEAMAAQHAVAVQGPAGVGDVKVSKAQGADARTVAEIFARKTELKDKTVTVRGKVVKSNSGIMGKNWIHVRDGSGSAAKKDDDLTVTTNGSAAVGDVVVVKGVVHVDRDFGAGYAYPVILEEATITK